MFHINALPKSVQTAHAWLSKRTTPKLLWVLNGLAVVAVLLATLWTPQLSSRFSVAPSARTIDVQNALLPQVVPQTFEQLAPEVAEARNDLRPLDKRPLEAALPFVLPVSATNPLEWNRAVNCLAMANYYEAISEGEQGMRAVSQVILNRVRHPAFPKSVCGVVFQGSERSTGCQFTFTCDGSLARAPSPLLFARARAVAMNALQGAVDVSVGMATHYHTRQVVPYWAASLDKIQMLGAHIFYVWHGGAGSRSAFNGRYEGETSTLVDRFLPAIPQLQEAVPQTALVLQKPPQSGLLADASTGTLPSAKGNLLVADERTKLLKADEEAVGTLLARPVVRLAIDHLAGN